MSRPAGRGPTGAPGTERRPVLKIILLGDSGVGKTSLMRQLVSGKFEPRYKATIGADFFTHEETITLPNGTTRKVNLQIWDTAGQERFQSLGSAFYRGADGCMVVFDVTSQESFKHVSSWLQEFKLQAGENKVALLVGNKSDLQEKREVFLKGVTQWCEEQNSHPMYGGGKMPHPLQYVETSAKDNSAVVEAFRQVARTAFQEKEGVDGQGGSAGGPELAPTVKTLKKGDGQQQQQGGKKDGGDDGRKKGCEC